MVIHNTIFQQNFITAKVIVRERGLNPDGRMDSIVALLLEVVVTRWRPHAIDKSQKSSNKNSPHAVMLNHYTFSYRGLFMGSSDCNPAALHLHLHLHQLSCYYSLISIIPICTQFSRVLLWTYRTVR